MSYFDRIIKKPIITTGKQVALETRSDRDEKRWLHHIGNGSYLGGYGLALVTGVFWPLNDVLLSLLLIMGVVVGFLNITDKESYRFLIAATALVLIGAAHPFTSFETVNRDIANNLNDLAMALATFTAPAALVVAGHAGLVLAAHGGDGKKAETKT